MRIAGGQQRGLFFSVLYVTIPFDENVCVPIPEKKMTLRMKKKIQEFI